MSTSAGTKTSSGKGAGSRNRQSRTAACNIKGELHNQPENEPEPLLSKTLNCSNLYDDGQVKPITCGGLSIMKGKSWKVSLQSAGIARQL
jgi:hypothetical protein